MTISAPGVDRAIGSQSHAVEVAGGNGDDVFEVPYSSRSQNLDGSEAIGSGAVSQFPELVIATGPDGTISSQQERVPAGGASGDGYDAASGLYGNGLILLADGAAHA